MAATPPQNLSDALASSVETAAPALLGCVLVSRGMAGVIVETEAYHQREPSCHAFRGPTPRTRPLFGPPGTAYVYFTYGMHWCFNVVAEDEGVGAAVLIRAVVPLLGEEAMHERRERTRALKRTELCSGPARLVQAMDIRSSDNERVVLATGPLGLQQAAADPDGVWVVRDPAAAELAAAGPAAERVSGPRIGISTAKELPWRFGIARHPYLSKRFPSP